MGDEANDDRDEFLVRRQRALRAFADQAGQSRRRCTFANWESPSPAHESARLLCEEWCTRAQQQPTNLVLYGPCGSGKDHLAFAAAVQLIASTAMSGIWVSCREWFAVSRDRIADSDSDLSLVRSLRSAGVVVLSDPLPPSGSMSDYQRDLLFRVADGRVGRRTILTVNVSDDAAAKQHLGTPTWDRLCDGAYKIRTAWKSFRRPFKSM